MCCKRGLPVPPLQEAFQMTEAAAPPSRFAAVLHWASCRPKLVLALLCLVLWAPGVFSLPPLDRDESRFAQSSKQMLETGDLIDIRFGAVPRYKKPVGIYWLQAATTAVTGLGERTQIWTYRLPSLIGALFAVWLTFWCARAVASAEASFLAASLLAGTLLLTAEATIATTDAVLLACVLGVQGMLLRAYTAFRTNAPPIGMKLALLGWAALGLGVLVKGPAVLAVPAVSMIGLSLWDKDGRWLKTTQPLKGLGLALLIALPWFIAIAVKSHGHFFEQSLGQDFATKLQGGQEPHGALPGYFLALLTLTFWPAILFFLPALAAAIRNRAEPALRFLLIWTASWAVFELVPTKLPHYVLPVYPALAILCALWLLKPQEETKLWQKVLSYAALLQFALGAAAIAAASLLLPVKYGTGMLWWVLVPVAVFAALAVTAAVACQRRALAAAALFAIAACVAIYPALTAGVGPQLTQLWVSPRAAAAAQDLSVPGDPPPSLAGYLEPSLVFLLGSETRQTDGHGAADAGAAQGGLALVEDREQGAFKARLAELEADATEVGALDGFNYSRGRKVHIRIWRVAPVREMPPPPEE
jgi:4-amino-4-deoxy-L-arabinose transferase-like glycosyltransferase